MQSSGNDPQNDWMFNQNEEPIKPHDVGLDETTKKQKKERLGSKIKNKLSNFKYKLSRKGHRKISFSLGLLLGLFIPLIVGLLVLYLLLPGMPMFAELFGTEVTVHWFLIFLLIPAEVNSFVPWIAWIISGVAGGLITGRILIPFISMYVLIWVLLFFIEGDMLLQQFSIFGAAGLNQILIQILATNFIFVILAFGFGGWIGTSIGGR